MEVIGISKLYAKGTYCKTDCTELCALCDNVGYLLDLGKVGEGRRWPDGLVLDERNECDRPAYVALNELKLEIFDWVKAGGNLFLHSEIPGNGKTTWANKLFMQFTFEYARLMVLKRKAELPDAVVRWVNVPEMFEQFKLEMSGAVIDPSLRKHLSNARLLVLDDLGAEKSSEWAVGQLYLYLNSRLENGLSTIITSNLSVDGLLNNGYVNRRIHSRLCTYQSFEFFGPDRRRLK